MSNRLAHIALVVKDYDEAIQYYTQTLDFVLIEDTDLGNGKRWVLVNPGHEKGCNLLLAKASTDEQKAVIGKQTGGRVFLFMHTDRFDTYYQTLIQRGVTIVREKNEFEYGTVAVFEDLYGNKWDLIQPATTQ